MRQEGLVRQNQLDFPVLLIGCGGIGSPTALALAKMGITQITVIDPDVIEPHNIPNQIFPLEKIGTTKVEALADELERYGGTRPTTLQERFTSTMKAKGVVISGVDSMEARQEIWKAVKNNPDVPLYIEARMAAQAGRVYAIDPLDRHHQKAYEATLYGDDQASPDPCTAKAIIFNVLGIASVIGSLVHKHAVRAPKPNEVLIDSANFEMLPSSW